jgi:hypothetical protein
MHCTGRKRLASSTGTCRALPHTAVTEECTSDVTPTSARSDSSHNDGKRVYILSEQNNSTLRFCYQEQNADIYSRIATCDFATYECPDLN